MGGARWQLVFFLVDDYGFADVGYHSDMYGTDPDPCNSTVTSWAAPCKMSAKNMRMETPNLDRLSAAGIRLENYYIQPVCSPTRATLLTGRYVFHHGVHVPFIDSSRSTLPLNETTLAERLQSAGYRTHMIGKVRTFLVRQRADSCAPARVCVMSLTDLPLAAMRSGTSASAPRRTRRTSVVLRVSMATTQAHRSEQATPHHATPRHATSIDSWPAA